MTNVVKFLFIIAVVLSIGLYYLDFNKPISDYLKFSNAILYFATILLVIPFNQIKYIVINPEDYTKNEDKDDLVKKLRLRALLFNNLTVILLLIIFIIIVVSFYLLILPPKEKLYYKEYILAVQIGVSVLLIFLVNILFRVFKYLLRVAAFYNARADAIELYIIDPGLDLNKYTELFTPSGYDISELPQSSWNPLSSVLPPSQGSITNPPLGSLNSGVGQNQGVISSNKT
ncbi:hypothetical protein [Spirosoma endbachense]|uniref:Uncharacterized protein n=1 Tax=Spirosoma endbachense TaxID=2666025 RepID=A0A6P1W6G6_9BACT|nr:hypothetical protein [Spirosoma endbachense]QHV99316.1 hypothetical protein GJR95_31790 [Spirosoma endbachense]